MCSSGSPIVSHFYCFEVWISPIGWWPNGPEKVNLHPVSVSQEMIQGMETLVLAWVWLLTGLVSQVGSRWPVTCSLLRKDLPTFILYSVPSLSSETGDLTFLSWYVSSIILQIDRNVGEDPRLEAFNKQWFENKDCLDIGCNQGLVTIGLGNSWFCFAVHVALFNCNYCSQLLL